MKTTVPFAVLFVALFAQAGNCQDKQFQDTLPPAPAGKTWKLAWHDEFDGTKLDATKWTAVDGRRRDDWWSPKAISLNGQGQLVMTVLRDGDKLLSGCVRTKGKFEHAFGYYVARMQFQKQQGHWTAFWMYNDGVGRIGDDGRDGTEIDIVEKPWLDARVTHNLHWDGYAKEHKSDGTTVSIPGVMDGFHTFSLLWLPDKYVFYVDGHETWRSTAGGVCQVPLYIKLSDEIGDWAGDIKKAKLPDSCLVDYVRVYDLMITTSSGSSKQ
jgi:beta-glucanase (GH16 family)